MTGARPADILRQLDGSGPPDAELLACYARQRDQAAFAELVRRHGPLVWAACRRMARHIQDAEDAFQAVFLILSRKAAAIREPGLLGNWLYGVAVRVGLKARRAAARRRTREMQVSVMPDPPDPRGLTPPGSPEFAPLLDEELAALPAWYREAIVLCDLRGVSREEAARLLGIPEGTLSSRLANGRKKLAARLAKRGITLAVAAIPGVLTSGARAAVPPELLAKTCGIPNSAIPTAVSRLASGDFTMTTKWFFGALGAAAMVAGAVYAARDDAPPQQTEPPKPVVAVKGDEKVNRESIVLTTKPRLVNTTDLRAFQATRMSWSPDGRSLIVWGLEPRVANEEHRRPVALILPDVIDPKPDGQRFCRVPLENATTLVCFAPDSKTVLTDVRESHLISGRHQLHSWDVVPDGTAILRQTVNLEDGETFSYAFAPDGKTFRTLAPEKNAAGQTKTVEVREVETATGKTVKTLLKADVADWWWLSPDGRRFAVLEDGAKLIMYDVDAGTKLFTKHLEKPPAGPEPRGPTFIELAFMEDCKSLMLSRGVGLTDIVNADTGDLGKKLKGIDMMQTFPERGSIGAGGRLLAMPITRFASVKHLNAERLEPKDSELMVWDLQTGKVLKSWDRTPIVAVNPVRPLLAIAEQNGDDTRLGLWDFAAEVGKK